MFTKFKALSLIKKLSLGFGALLVVSMLGGASKPQPANLNIQPTGKTSVLGSQTTADSPQPKASTLTYKTVTETQSIPFLSTTVPNSGMAVGQSKIITPGTNGVLTLTYKLTYADGQQTDKALVSQVTTKQPITQVTSIGTYVTPRTTAPTPAVSTTCDPNYTGCVPIASDVDCAGGGGNGPAYVPGPLRVIGTDIYRLDADNNGIACE